ncbi:Peptidase M14, carboxypeptidase A domain and Proteinase inhibitor, carboxypeptidase propeptide domain and Proteinase inhibitor, propeptide domain-containing protein, partial [Strongyloides ratti]
MWCIFKIIIIVIIFEAKSFTIKRNYTSHSVYNVNFLNEIQVNVFKEYISKFNLDLWKDIGIRRRTADVHVPPNKKENFTQFLDNFKINYYIKIENLGKIISEEEKELGERSIFKKGNHPSLMTIDEFHDLNEIENYIDSLGKTFDTVKVIKVGTSFEKRTIYGVIITKNNSISKKKVLINGCIHAREWLSCSTMIYIMNELTNNSKKYDDFLSKTEVHIIPVVNVDGYVYTWSNDRLWRKTRSGPYNGCYGVDPNRNFDFKWKFSGYSTNPCDQTYAGPKSFSEPESKALGDYLKNAFLNGYPFSVYFDIHTYSENFIYPYSYDHVYPKNINKIIDISKKATEAIYSINQSNFNFGSVSDIIYPASGSTIDFATSIAGVEYAFAIELRPNEYVTNGFIISSNQIIDGASEAWE